MPIAIDQPGLYLFDPDVLVPLGLALIVLGLVCVLVNKILLRHFGIEADDE